MNYISVAELASRWGLSERSVRNYCAEGRIAGAVIQGKTWLIPEDAQRPTRKVKQTARTLLEVLKAEKAGKQSGGIYHKLQIELTYNSNHIEGSRLTHDQTRYIYETNTIGAEDGVIRVDDVVETVNHFRCIDLMIEKAGVNITEALIKQLHGILKSGTSDSRLDWFVVGEYKRLPNEVGGRETTAPEDVPQAMRELLEEYNNGERKCLEDLLDFHWRFERIHPFQDGNGRVGRLLLLKECLHYGIVPFVIDESLKLYYYRGLAEWPHEKGFLVDTCLTAQDRFQAWLDYFRIG